MHEGYDGWIDLRYINDFPKMRKFRLSNRQVFEMMKKSIVVDVEERDPFGNEPGDEPVFYIRKRDVELNPEYGQIFGFDMETIKMLTKEQFEIFLEHKSNFEKEVIKKFPCIVTTVGTASTKAMVERRFKRVVMDEATMVKEHEAFLATLYAEQVLLVGDQKQLGPTYGFKVQGPTSLYSRLIQAGHPHSFLDTQYRMHESLMQVPNMLFYDNLIKCGYTGDIHKMYLYSKRPFLFVNVTNGQEKLKGTSFANFEEVQACVDMANLSISMFKESNEMHKEAEQIPEQRFQRSDIYIITPYNA